jgi:hypothetical protein
VGGGGTLGGEALFVGRPCSWAVRARAARSAATGSPRRRVRHEGRDYHGHPAAAAAVRRGGAHDVALPRCRRVILSLEASRSLCRTPAASDSGASRVSTIRGYIYKLPGLGPPTPPIRRLHHGSFNSSPRWVLHA